MDHLKGNIEALGVELTPEEIHDIDDSEPFDVGFPLAFLFEFGGQTYRNDMTASDLQLIRTVAHIETVLPTRVSGDDGQEHARARILTVVLSPLNHGRAKGSSTH